MNFWHVLLIDLFASAANATADYFMLELGSDVGRLRMIMSWTRLQWYWHLAKWAHFNLPLGIFTYVIVDNWMQGLIIAFACLLTWELVYLEWLEERIKC